MNWTESQIQPKYEQVKESILCKIHNNEISPSSFLPSEQDLADFFDVGRNTVRKAISELKKEGIISTGRGKKNKVIAQNQQKSSKSLVISWIGKEENETFSPIYFKIFKAAQKEADQNGLKMILASFDPNDSNYLNSSTGIDGAIIAGVREDMMGTQCRNAIKKISSRIGIDDVEGIPVEACVCTDNYAGGRMATEHLLETGRKHICFLGIANSFDIYTPFWERLKGYRDILSENNICLPSSMTCISTMPRDFYEIKPKLREILKENSQIDSFFVSSDELAARVIFGLRDIGIRIPEEIAVMGYDGLVLGEKTMPKLSTVCQPTEEIGQKACTILNDMMRNKKNWNGVLKLNPSLVIRESTRS